MEFSQVFHNRQSEYRVTFFDSCVRCHMRKCRDMYTTGCFVMRDETFHIFTLIIYPQSPTKIYSYVSLSSIHPYLGYKSNPFWLIFTGCKHSFFDEVHQVSIKMHASQCRPLIKLVGCEWTGRRSLPSVVSCRLLCPWSGNWINIWAKVNISIRSVERLGGAAVNRSREVERESERSECAERRVWREKKTHNVVALGIPCDTSGHVLVHYPGFCLMVKLREQNTRWKSGNLLTSRIELATTTWIEEVRFSRALFHWWSP